MIFIIIALDYKEFYYKTYRKFLLEFLLDNEFLGMIFDIYINLELYAVFHFLIPFKKEAKSKRNLPSNTTVQLPFSQEAIC